MRIPSGLEDILSIDPEIQGGAVCFIGTRLPLSVLLDNLSEGMSVEEFVQDYGSITVETAMRIVRRSCLLDG